MGAGCSSRVSPTERLEHLADQVELTRPEPVELWQSAVARATGTGFLGVVQLEDWGEGTGYIPLPGDIDSKESYKVPFVAAIAKGVNFKDDGVLINPEQLEDEMKRDEITKELANTFANLIKQRVGAIVSNCGLFMWLHAHGIVEVAVDIAMTRLASQDGAPYCRPTVALSSLTMMASLMATLGCGKAQIAKQPTWWSEQQRCKAVVFTSNGASCVKLLRNVPQASARFQPIRCYP